MTKKNVALIGYGYWGKKLYKYLKESEHFNLVYVHFRSLARMSPEIIESEYGKEFVPKIEKIWDDHSVDNVIIATPIDTHVALAREALFYHKNVLVEKPLALKKEDAIALKDSAEKNGLVLMTEYTFTFSRGLLQAKQIVADGVIGKVENIDIRIKQLGRFPSYDVFSLLGSHALSILGLFFPLSVFKFTATELMRNNDVVSAGLVQFTPEGEGPNGYIDVSLHSPVREKKVTLYGTEGSLIYDVDAKDTICVTRYSRKPTHSEDIIETEVQAVESEEKHNLRHALKTFHQALEKERRHNLDNSVAVSSILDLIHQQLKISG